MGWVFLYWEQHTQLAPRSGTTGSLSGISFRSCLAGSQHLLSSHVILLSSRASGITMRLCALRESRGLTIKEGGFPSDSTSSLHRASIHSSTMPSGLEADCHAQRFKLPPRLFLNLKLPLGRGSQFIISHVSLFYKRASISYLYIYSSVPSFYWVHPLIAISIRRHSRMLRCHLV